MSRHFVLLCLAATALVGCPEPPPAPTCGPTGLATPTGTDLLDPWPNAHLVAEKPGGCRLEISSDWIPVGDSTPMDPSRWSYRDGFSPVGTILWRSGVALDAANLPPLADPGRCLADDSPIQLWDLDAGERLPCFAELDAWPLQEESERVLLIRPMVHMGFDRHIGVAITTALLTQSGEPVARPPGFEAIVAGDRDLPEPVLGHYAALLTSLEELGTSSDELVLAWDFPTASRDRIMTPLETVLQQMRSEMPLEAQFEPEVVITDLFDADAGDVIAPGLWREVRGSLRLTHYLWSESGEDDATESEHDGGWFRVDPETGVPAARAEDDAFFTLVLPDSVRGADPGSVPVVIFGHGIFAAPGHYISATDDGNATVELCNRLAAICVGGEWRGLTTRDVADSVRVATNLGRFPLLTDKLVQGVSNQLALARAFRTAFIEQDFLQVEGGSIVDPDQIVYFGISLGGIEGATLLANSEVVDTGVLHVPGAVWATMLERSSHWTDFEEFVAATQPDPASRQVIYALSQLLWDPVDPVNHAGLLGDKAALWQVSIGDEQVPNFTAEVLARTLGLSIVGEPVTRPWGLDVVPAPVGPGASGMTQFDSGHVRPPDDNRPAAVTGAHTAIRHTVEMQEQVAAFLANGGEGTIVHPCDGPCVFDPDD